MHKIFQRSKIGYEIPHQFLRHKSLTVDTLPFINSIELSEKERLVYESLWRDLNPFNVQKVENEAILKLLNTCNLEHSKLEQVIIYMTSI